MSAASSTTRPSTIRSPVPRPGRPRALTLPPCAAPSEVLCERGDQNEHEQDLRRRGRVADVPAIEAYFVNEQHERARCIVRSALRHELRLAEQLELQHDLDDEHQYQGATNRRQRDAPKRPPPAGIVERRRLIQLARHLLQGREEQHHRQTDAPPYRGNGDRRQREIGVTQKRDRFAAEPSRYIGDQATVRQEHDAPQQRDDRDGQHRRRKENSPQQRRAARAAV